MISKCKKPVSIDEKMQTLKFRLLKNIWSSMWHTVNMVENKDALRKAHKNVPLACKNVRTAKHSDIEAAALLM